MFVIIQDEIPIGFFQEQADANAAMKYVKYGKIVRQK